MALSLLVHRLESREAGMLEGSKAFKLQGFLASQLSRIRAFLFF
jgi:hypothetical protein